VVPWEATFVGTQVDRGPDGISVVLAIMFSGNDLRLVTQRIFLARTLRNKRHRSLSV
jgi:hypothetical protein